MEVNEFMKIEKQGLEKVIAELKNEIIHLVDRHEISLKQIEVLEHQR